MEEPVQLKEALISTTAGAISGGIQRMVTSPLDVIKIRFQVLILVSYLSIMPPMHYTIQCWNLSLAFNVLSWLLLNCALFWESPPSPNFH